MQLEHSQIEHLQDSPASDDSVASVASAYEAPVIESVLSPESLEREVHYAGAQVGSGGVEL
ncbi:hypothetical protein IAD21_02288 [Abditibacteriota bacterium]|nr:hypothetical protein IAD21_02288 [Abditibacteriota bacterium]